MKLCIITGEASGDQHAAGLVRELRRMDSSFAAFGIGGSHLQAEGMTLLYHVRDLAIVGLFNVIRHLPMYWRVLRHTVAALRRESPDALVLVDFPDFNLRLARRARKMGIPVYYYIPPQLWAWRRRRIEQIRRNVDHVLVMFPFELEFFRGQGVSATYVGHPVVEQLREMVPRDPLRPAGDPLRVALMPGSRRAEVDDVLAAMIDAIGEIARSRAVEAVVIQAPTIDRAQIEAILARKGLPLEISSGGIADAAGCDLAIASSGTATLEMAVLGVPVVVVYRLTPLTYALARRLVKLEHFSLVNIVAGKRIVPELLQEEVNGSSIARSVLEMVEPQRYLDLLAELRKVRATLGEEGASRRAAEVLARLVHGRVEASC